MQDKDTSIIPKGDYCYVFDGRKGIDEETGLPWLGVKRCPYWIDKEINGVQVDWCNFLDLGDVGNYDRTDDDLKKLIDYFGSEENLREKMPLLLLWDGVKECGQNPHDCDIEDQAEEETPLDAQNI